MPKDSSKQKDTQELSRSVPDAVVPDAEPPKSERERNPAGVSLGKLGGKKGGPARAARLTAEQRKQIAKRAAARRWAGKRIV